MFRHHRYKNLMEPLYNLIIATPYSAAETLSRCGQEYHKSDDVA